jgi:sulfoxide reductase heme-binding subunit YedZ
MTLFAHEFQGVLNTFGWAQKRPKWARFTPLQTALHLLAWLPWLVLIVDAQIGNLSANPIQEATQRMGRAAILLLMASLAVTPVRLLSGVRSIQPLARPLGLYAFLYALTHLFLYVGIDYGFDFSLILPDVQNKSYIFIGLAAFLILLSLAITSFRWWMKRLGKRWKLLHRLVYLAGVLAVIHYALAVKGDILRLRGSVGIPVFYAVLLGFLLIIRLPIFRKGIRSAREQVFQLFRGKRNAV